MTDYNVRDVFSLFTGRCGHKWVADADWHACPTCGDGQYREGGQHVWGGHVVAAEPIPSTSIVCSTRWSDVSFGKKPRPAFTITSWTGDNNTIMTITSQAGPPDDLYDPEDPGPDDDDFLKK